MSPSALLMGHVVHPPDHSLLLHWQRIFTEHEFLSGIGESGKTGDRKVLVVPVRFLQLAGSLDETCVNLDSWVGSQDTHLLHDRKNPGLAIVVTVSANAEVDLFRVGVSDVSSGEGKDAT